MMKKHLGVILLAVAAVVLGGIYLWLETTDNAMISGALYSLAEDEEIVSISIHNRYGEYDFELAENGRWTVTSDGNSYRTHASKMELVVSALTNVNITRILGEEIADYGLEKPEATVACSTNRGVTHTFAVGNETVSRSEAYIRDENSGKVMVTTTAAVAQFTGSLSAYRDKEIFTIDKNNIASIDYYKDGERVVSLSKTGGSWNLNYPFEAPARQIEMNEFLSDCVKWTAAGFPDEGDLNYAGMGLEDSGTWIDFTDAAGSAQRLLIGSQRGTGTYVRTGGEDEVAVMYTTDLDLSRLDPNVLIFVSPLKCTIDQVASITVQTAAGSDTFEVEQLENGQRITSDGVEINSTQFTSVFFKYLAMNADGYAPGEPGQGTVAVLTTTYVDGTTAQLVLLPRDESTYYMLVDGKTDFYINVSELEELLYRIDRVKGRA